MAASEIAEKLNMFFGAHTPVTEECHVVYIMVELRKMLEHEKATKTSPLAFYCDWVVHTEKDRITDDIRVMIDKIYQDVRQKIASTVYTRDDRSAVVDLLYFQELKKEVRAYLLRNDIIGSVTEDGNWNVFVSLLVKILENQPINNPTKDVTKFMFTPANQGCCYGYMEFAEPIGKYTHFEFGNAY